MARSLHVRLDDSSAAALKVVRAGTTSDSEAVRTALREAAARRRTSLAIAAEVARLVASAEDRAEISALRAELDALMPDESASA